MILKSLFGLSLVLNVSLDTVPPNADPATWTQLSAPQKQEALLPLVTHATECIARQVSADPRYSAEMRSDEFNDLIVDSITVCGRQVRAMMEAHDRMFGYGSGEAFLLGPYLDVLPAAVVKQVKVKTPSQ
jgi:hypothetical protein